MWDEGEPKRAFDKAMQYSNKVGMSLSDLFCVERHKSHFLDLVKNKLDITFANEQEIMSLISTENFDEVIKRANNNDLGLASYIFTNNMEKAHKASELMETGTVAVNTPVVAIAEAPFGGIKQTGYGREGGSMAIKDYLNIKYTHFGISYE